MGTTESKVNKFKQSSKSPKTASVDNQQQKKKDNIDTQRIETRSEDSSIPICSPELISEHEAAESDICGDINSQNTDKENLQRDSPRKDVADEHEKPEEIIEEDTSKENMEISSIKSEDTSEEQSTQEPTQNKELNQNVKTLQVELKNDNPKSRRLGSLINKLKKKKKTKNEQEMNITNGTTTNTDKDNLQSDLPCVNENENITIDREEAIPNSNLEHEEQSKIKKKQKDKKDKKKKKYKKDDSPDQYQTPTSELQTHEEKTMDNTKVIEVQECMHKKNMEESSDKDFPHQATQCESKAVESETCVDKNSQTADEENLQIATLRKENELKRALEEAEGYRQRKENELKRALEEAEGYRQSKKQLQEQLKKKENELKRALEEAEGYRQRFSKLSGAKMTEGNPNIEDLSDPNRPTKLGEKYSELYDNEWTDAFEMLTLGKLMHDKKRTIKLLCRIVVECYEQCMKIAKEQWETLATALSQNNITDNADETLKEIGFQETEFKDLKNYRRKAAKLSSENIVEKVKTALIQNGSLDEASIQKLKEYIEACARLSWKMALQDPPLHMFWDLKKDDPPNNMFKTYTKNGTKVKYVVWPCLLRQEGGDLLVKGVYQLYE